MEKFLGILIIISQIWKPFSSPRKYFRFSILWLDILGIFHILPEICSKPEVRWWGKQRLLLKIQHTEITSWMLFHNVVSLNYVVNWSKLSQKLVKNNRKETTIRSFLQNTPMIVVRDISKDYLLWFINCSKRSSRFRWSSKWHHFEFWRNIWFYGHAKPLVEGYINNKV